MHTWFTWHLVRPWHFVPGMDYRIPQQVRSETVLAEQRGRDAMARTLTYAVGLEDIHAMLSRRVDCLGRVRRADVRRTNF